MSKKNSILEVHRLERVGEKNEEYAGSQTDWSLVFSQTTEKGPSLSSRKRCSSVVQGCRCRHQRLRGRIFCCKLQLALSGVLGD